MRMLTVAVRLPFMLLGALFLCLGPAPGVRAGGGSDSGEDVEQLLARGRRALEGGGNVEAVTLLKKADKLAKGSCQRLW
jgi:hypothetical protein